jgi:hypothetical protein
MSENEHPDNSDLLDKLKGAVKISNRIGSRSPFTRRPSFSRRIVIDSNRAKA